MTSDQDPLRAVRGLLASNWPGPPPTVPPATLPPVPPAPPAQPLPPTPPPTAVWEAPPVPAAKKTPDDEESLRTTPAEWFIAAGAVAIAALGFATSFRAVSALARRHGFGPRLCYTVPLGFDLGIFVGSAGYILLTRRSAKTRQAPRWMRLIPWGLSAATVFANVMASPDLVGRVLHAAMISLWIAFVEVAAFVARQRMGMESTTRVEGIPWSRWLCAPIRTARLWRSMHLWQITKYLGALDREAEIQDLRLTLRHDHGLLRWRWKAPREDLLKLRQLSRLSPRRTTLAGTASATGQPAVEVPPPGLPVPADRGPVEAAHQTPELTPPTVPPDRPSGVSPAGPNTDLTVPPAPRRKVRTGQPVSRKEGQLPRSAGTAPTGQSAGQVSGQVEVPDQSAPADLTGDELRISLLIGPIQEAARQSKTLGRPAAQRIWEQAGCPVGSSSKAGQLLKAARSKAGVGDDGQVISLTGRRRRSGSAS